VQLDEAGDLIFTGETWQTQTWSSPIKLCPETLNNVTMFSGLAADMKELITLGLSPSSKDSCRCRLPQSSVRALPTVLDPGPRMPVERDSGEFLVASMPRTRAIATTELESARTCTGELKSLSW
jgi:hypothetical protein